MADTINNAEKIAKICAPLFLNSDIKTFYYARIYDTGQCLIFCSNSEWLSYKTDNGFTVLAPISWEQGATKQYHLIPQQGDALHSKIIFDGSSIFNIYHPFDLVYRREDYYELYSYAFGLADANAANFYLNNLAMLEKFSFYFNEQAERLISEHEQKNKFYLPSDDLIPIKYLNTSYANILDDLLVKKVSINGGNGEVQLSHREIECLLKLSEGYSYKKIAQLLGGISPRTIEGRIESLKVKTGCKNKNELAAFAQRVKKSALI